MIEMTDDLPKRYTWLELVEMSLTMTEDFVRARHEAENHLAERYHESFEKALEDVEAVFERTEALRSLSSKAAKNCSFPDISKHSETCVGRL